MKKIISLIMILSLLSCIGCSNAPSEEGTPFYYALAAPDYSGNNSAIVKEYREDLPAGTLAETLTLYLAGPEDSRFVSPFPADLQIIEAKQEGKTVYLTVSMELTGLTGLDLTIACGCLTLTCLALTDAELVQITPNYGLLDGQKTIVMDKNTLLLFDSSRNGN